jgi:hypothetical protein
MEDSVSVVKRLLLFLLLVSPTAFAQNAQLTGIVKDPSGAAIRKATVTLKNQQTGTALVSTTNEAGFYTFASAAAGTYTVSAEARGFSNTSVENVRLETNGDQRLDIEVKIEHGSQTVTVQASSVNMNTSDASISTVMDQQLISELPLNGRSLDTLFLLTPGVVSTGTQNDGGQYSVNGQRATGNQLSVDGASGNVFLSSQPGGVIGYNQNGFAGSTYATSTSGGTNGLLPVDAIEEYRIQTSTYSAEYGRSPGGQIQIRTRGGTSSFHGSAFEYFRNQVMDATDWFVKYDDLQQAPLRMNDFGGTLSGPLLKNRLFFFVANETLDLDQPSNTTVSVPSQYALQTAGPTFAPLLRAYPNGNGGTATTSKYPQYTDIYNAAYSTSIMDHTTSARFDVDLPKGYKLFFRFNLAPSSSSTSVWSATNSSLKLDTYTLGLTKSFTPSLLGELTVNYSKSSASYNYSQLPLGGSDPSSFDQFCASNAFSPTGSARCLFAGLRGWAQVAEGSALGANLAQWNFVDKLHWTLQRHSLSFGVDFRRLSTSFKPYSYDEIYSGYFNGPAAFAGSIVDRATTETSTAANLTLPVDNASLFAQDDWHITNWLTINCGLRWEFNPPISDGHGGPLALTGNTNNLASLQPAPAGTPLYKTEYGAFAPRLGFAYQLQNRKDFATVLRAGAGIFYDTGQAASTAASAENSYPYSIGTYESNVAYSSLNFQALQQSAAYLSLPYTGILYVVDPNLKLPYTGEWNVAVEQQLFGNTLVSAAYLGADGEQLASTTTSYGLSSALVSSTGTMELLNNRGRSNYQALQLQATIRAALGIDGIVAYTYSHNIDNGTSDFTGTQTNVTDYRGNADDDVRHMLSVGLSLRLKRISQDKLLRIATNGWVVNTFSRLQTASPLSVTSTLYIGPTINDFAGFADIVPGVPVYLRGPSAGSCAATKSCIPGGIQLNPAAFTNPPTATSPNLPYLLRDGDSRRNAYRLFGLHEFDLSAGRKFDLTDRVGLEFKAEAFNVLNTPNFANVQTVVDNASFGQAQNTYAGYAGVSGGGLNTAFQSGGPRNLQLTARLVF